MALNLFLQTTIQEKTESLKGHDEYYKVYTPIVKEYMDKHELKDDSELPDYFVTAQTLDYKNRIYMQSIWQSHIDASISLLLMFQMILQLNRLKIYI